MDDLASLIERNENWLIKRILHYAKERGYTKYTSTLEEAWRLSISGLSASLIAGIKQFKSPPDFGPDDDLGNDPLTSFGMLSAQRHRRRGVTLAMFLGLMKYYRQSYMDLLYTDSVPREELDKRSHFLHRCFDRIELAFCQEWAGKNKDAVIRELQTASRFMTNEKNAYLTVFESLSDPVIMLNAQDEIINLNNAAARLIDHQPVPGAHYYHPEKMENPVSPGPSVMTGKVGKLYAGKSVLELFPWLSDVMTNIRNELPSEDRLECQAAVEGGERFFEVRHSAMLDVSEKFTATIITLRDITSHKRARDDREQFLRTMSKKNKELQSIVYVASHDLRSPLVNIHGFSAILDEDCRLLYQSIANSDDAELIEKIGPLIHESIPKSLHFIRAGTIKMQSILDGLLQVSRIGTVKIHIEPLDVNEILGDILDAMNFQIQQQEIEITCDTLPACRGDREQINQVLSNLIDNAMKYRDLRRPGHIHISGWAEIDQSIYCVEDNGIGIPARCQERIFEMFHRLDPNGPVRGEGLGLSIISRILDRNHGRIWLESREGIGSKFFVALPYCRHEQARESVQEDRGSKGKATVKAV
ncbi:MAG: hypothetical protein JW860_05590 [Sedimentisphaerales bacterium]|nr:hypothetical protein [Sedimentisphaerales bacterium]